MWAALIKSFDVDGFWNGLDTVQRHAASELRERFPSDLAQHDVAGDHLSGAILGLFYVGHDRGELNPKELRI